MPSVKWVVKTARKVGENLVLPCWRTGKGNPYLNGVLVEAAVVAACANGFQVLWGTDGNAGLLTLRRV